VLFALDAAQMGTWEWNIASNQVTWSENLERIRGLPENTFDGTFESYLREIRQEDRDRVLGALQRSLREGTPHDVEYRIVAPDGTVRWVLGKGRVEHDASGAAVRTARENAAIVERNGASLARLVDDLLDMSRMNIGQIELERQPVHLAPGPVTRDVARGSRPSPRAPTRHAR
jgi:PAS domain-containing protein